MTVEMKRDEKYGFTMPLGLMDHEPADTVRKFLKSCTNQIAAVLMRHYLSDDRACDIDIQVTVTPKTSKKEN